MKRLPRIATALAIAFIANGCATMEWSKAGADRAAVARDQDACRSQALGSTAPVSPPGSSEAATDGRRPGGMSPSGTSNERFMDESEAVRSCMLRRGYVLRPAS